MPGSANVLVKPASGDCNLACEYCFYHERLTDPYAAQTHRRMNDSVLRTLVRQVMDLAGTGRASFGWQGGEPTLAGLGFFRRVVAYQQRYGRKGQVVSNPFFYEQLRRDREQGRRKYGRGKGKATRGLASSSLFPQVQHRPLAHYEQLVQGGGIWKS